MGLGVGVQQAEGDLVPCQGPTACEALARPPPGNAEAGLVAMTQLPGAAEPNPLLPGPDPLLLGPPQVESYRSDSTCSNGSMDPGPEQLPQAEGRPQGLLLHKASLDVTGTAGTVAPPEPAGLPRVKKQGWGARPYPGWISGAAGCQGRAGHRAHGLRGQRQWSWP